MDRPACGVRVRPCGRGAAAAAGEKHACKHQPVAYWEEGGLTKRIHTFSRASSHNLWCSAFPVDPRNFQRVSCKLD